MDVTYFERLWNEKEQIGSSQSKESKLWDGRVKEFNSQQPDERITLITGMLEDKGMLHKGSSVLDIGCGPGKFALAFAQTAKSVTGLDISQKMLQQAENNCAESGANNVEFVQMDWEKVNLCTLKWRKRFDLVTAIMSPAFCSKASLDKMIEASRGGCLISHFVKRSDSVGDPLRQQIIGINDKEDLGNRGLYCSLNILWLYKLYPEVFYFNTEREVTRSLPEARSHYLSKLEMSANLSKKKKEDANNLLLQTAEKGIVRERITAKIACIYWKNN